MAKNNKKNSKIGAKINEKNLMIVLAVILLISVSVLVFKNLNNTKILEPTVVEQQVTE